MGYERKMKGHMMMCPMCGAIVGGMTRVGLAATSDGGALVSANGRLMKYDSQLNLVKQIDLPLDIEQIHRRMLEMMENPLHDKMKEKWKEMMARYAEEEGKEESPGHHHHGRKS
jgi:hypothetical protein